jgi:hypothetical protein
MALHLEHKAGDRPHAQAGQFGGAGGGEVHREGPDQTPEDLGRNPGTAVVLVFAGIHRARYSLLALSFLRP